MSTDRPTYETTQVQRVTVRDLRQAIAGLSDEAVVEFLDESEWALKFEPRESRLVIVMSKRGGVFPEKGT